VRTRLPYPNDVAIDNYPTIKEEAPFLRDVLRRARALPGVDEAEAGSSSAIPLDHPLRDANVYPFLIEGRGTDPTQAPLVAGSAVTPGYFHVLSMTLLRGRLLTEFDNETAPNVAVVNEAMARAFWPHEDPLGRRVRLTRLAPEWTTVVGIVADARSESLEDAGVPEIFASAYQRPAKHLAIFLRGRFDQAATPDRVRELIQSADPTLPVFGAQMLSDTVAGSVADRRFSMRMVALFALTALLMAALGIYGVISYFVSERTREIAIRVALGAERRTVLRMILGEGLALAFAGVGVGLVCALIAARVMAGVLYGVTPADPITFIGVAGVLIAVALIACCVPAQRALRIDPLTALRHE
jgi:putative ABC transport system permease protein